VYPIPPKFPYALDVACFSGLAGSISFVRLPGRSVYDLAMSDILIVILILLGRLIETGFTVNYRIPSQPKEDGFCLQTVPLYGGTITTPHGKTIIVMKYAQHTCCLPLPSAIRPSTPILTPHATSEKLCCHTLDRQLIQVYQS